jgi:GTPase SAR1 family protein
MKIHIDERRHMYFIHKLIIYAMFILSVGKIDIGNVRLNFWDLGGQEELQSLWDKVSMMEV